MRDLRLHQELVEQDLQQHHEAQLRERGLDHLTDAARYVLGSVVYRNERTGATITLRSTDRDD